MVPDGDRVVRDIELRCVSPEQIAALDDRDVVDGLGAVRRARDALDAREARFLARLAELRGDGPYVADEAALELRISRNMAATRVATAVDLVTRMPGVLGLMGDGEIDGYTAGRLTHACRTLSDDDAHRVDELLLEKHARGKLNLTDPVSLRRTTQRLAQRVDPASAVTRARRARCERKVQLIPGEDTMATLIADLPAEVAASAYARIDHDARRLRNTGDERTLDQLRADVLADLLTNTSDSSGTGGGAVVYLHMPIDAALTMTDSGCELSGYGPIPGPIAREIMTNPHSVLRAVLTDPGTGQITGLGRTRRKPNQPLRDLIAVRDRECVFCHRPAQLCDVDHLADWVANQGPTDPGNLAPKCEHDHYLKDADNWETHFDPDTGIGTITTPTGHTNPRYREPIIEPPEPEPDPPPEPKILLPDDPPF